MENSGSSLQWSIPKKGIDYICINGFYGNFVVGKVYRIHSIRSSSGLLFGEYYAYIKNDISDNSLGGFPIRNSDIEYLAGVKIG